MLERTCYCIRSHFRETTTWLSIQKITVTGICRSPWWSGHKCEFSNCPPPPLCAFEWWGDWQSEATTIGESSKSKMMEAYLHLTDLRALHAVFWRCNQLFCGWSAVDQMGCSDQRTFLNLFDAAAQVWAVYKLVIHDMFWVWPRRINCTAQRRASWRGVANQWSSPENQRRGLALPNTTNWKSSVWNCRCPNLFCVALNMLPCQNNLMARKVLQKILWCWISWPANRTPTSPFWRKQWLWLHQQSCWCVSSQCASLKADGSQVEASLLRVCPVCVSENSIFVFGCSSCWSQIWFTAHDNLIMSSLSDKVWQII